MWPGRRPSCRSRTSEASRSRGGARARAGTFSVRAARAALQLARLNLGFTRLISPIDGIAGIAQQQVGALVSPASGAVTTVSTLDPIKVYFNVSEQEYLDFNRRFPTQATRDAETGR